MAVSVYGVAPRLESPMTLSADAAIQLWNALSPGEWADRLTIELLKISQQRNLRYGTMDDEAVASVGCSCRRIEACLVVLSRGRTLPNNGELAMGRAMFPSPVGSAGRATLWSEWSRLLASVLPEAIGRRPFSLIVGLGLINSDLWLAESKARQQGIDSPNPVEALRTIQRLNADRVQMKNDLNRVMDASVFESKVY